MHVDSFFSEDFRKCAEEILERKIEEVRKTITANISCEKVINIFQNIFQQSGWNKDDELILNGSSKEFIKECLKKSPEFTNFCIKFYRQNKRTKCSNNFEKFQKSLEEAVEELEIEKARKDYIKNLLNSG